MNKKRFFEKFTKNDAEDGLENKPGITLPCTFRTFKSLIYLNNFSHLSAKKFFITMPICFSLFVDDFKNMFKGNSDDFFRVGLVIMQKTIKLYTEFYSSDIIIASPVGLRSIIGAEG